MIQPAVGKPNKYEESIQAFAIATSAVEIIYKATLDEIRDRFIKLSMPKLAIDYCNVSNSLEIIKAAFVKPDSLPFTHSEEVDEP